MQKNRATILIWLPAIVLTLAGCGGDISFSPLVDLDSDPVLIPAQPDREALAIALWLSGELTAPPELYERIRTDLRIVRKDQRDTVPAVDLKFFEPWEPGRLVIGFDAWTYQLISGGLYQEWDSLNRHYSVDRVDLSMPTFNMLKLKFTDPLNPEVLAEAYEKLPGVRFAVPNWYLGDRSMLLPSHPDSRVLYFFRNAWGDCPSGCLYSEYWVYAVISGNVVYDGFFAEISSMPHDLRAGLAAAWDNYH